MTAAVIITFIACIGVMVLGYENNRLRKKIHSCIEKAPKAADAAPILTRAVSPHPDIVFRDAIAMMVLEKLMATPRDAPRSIADEAQLAYLYADGMLIASGRRAGESDLLYWPISRHASGLLCL